MNKNEFMITITKISSIFSKGQSLAIDGKLRSNRGFTLVELMVTLALTGIVIAAIYATFRIQQKSYTAQDQVVEMQQNIRASLSRVSFSMRMAGYDASGTGSANAGVYVAVANGIAFSADFNEDGDVSDVGEHNAYDLYNVTKADGSIVPTLGRTISNAAIASGAPADGGLFAGHQPIGDYIEQLEFWYMLDDGTRTLAPTAAQLDRIVSVDVSLLAIAPQRDAKYTSTANYTSASGVDWTGTSQTDGFRRRFFTSRIKLRNLGT